MQCLLLPACWCRRIAVRAMRNRRAGRADVRSWSSFRGASWCSRLRVYSNLYGLRLILGVWTVSSVLATIRQVSEKRREQPNASERLSFGRRHRSTHAKVHGIEGVRLTSTDIHRYWTTRTIQHPTCSASCDHQLHAQHCVQHWERSIVDLSD